MKKQINYFWFFLFLFFLFIPFKAQTTPIDRTVVDSSDNFGSGTLRSTIDGACRSPGDDIIHFDSAWSATQVRILLNAPLIIPETCQGSLTIQGPSDYHEILIDGAQLPNGGGVPGDSCVLYVYSDNNAIINLTLVGNSRGAGVCLFGKNNRVSGSYFGKDHQGHPGPNLFGIVLSNYFTNQNMGMDGSHNQVIGNHFFSGRYGVFSQANESAINQNQMTDQQDTAIIERGDGTQIDNNIISTPLRIGISVHGNNLLVGGNEISNVPFNAIEHRGTGAMIENNHILNSGQNGILTSGDNNHFIDNQIDRPVGGSGIVAVGNDLWVEGNAVSHSFHDGMQFSGNRIRATDNQITDGAGFGILYAGDGAQIGSNRISNAGKTGIYLQGLHASIYDNQVLHTVLAGIDQGGTEAVIQNNEIQDTQKEGIISSGDSNRIVSNQVSQVRESGIVVNGNGETLQSNYVHDITQTGISGTGDNFQILWNTIEDTQGVGLGLKGSLSTLDSNHIQRGSQSGLVVFGNDNRLLANNISLMQQEDGIRYTGHPAQLSYNTITQVGFFGMRLKGNNLMVNENRISQTGSAGIHDEGQGSLFKNNRIEHCLGDGIIHQGDQTHFVANRVMESGQSGLMLDGDDLEIKENRIQESSDNGLHLEGDRLTISSNEIFGNGWSGIWIHSADSHMSKNQILSNGGCPDPSNRLASQTIGCLNGLQTGGPGILITAGSNHLEVGGAVFEDRNIIQYNGDGGVIILGDASSQGHKITHNTLSKNYGLEPNLDLSGNGLTANDLDDADEGPNHLLNFVDVSQVNRDYLQVFPLVSSPTDEARYWTWGLARHGTAVELYRVPEEDRQRGRKHGGGEIFYGESPIQNLNFSIPPHPNFNSFDDQWVTTLSFDGGGNTSEFGTNVLAGVDDDLDGIVNSLESNDGSSHWVGSSDLSADSDGDGLPDPIEDRNRNGRWDRDLGETSAYLADSDGDGLTDWVETHGDGIYNPEEGDTDPLNPDTDGDGLRDGDEDRNANGIWESYLRETSPLLIDSDGDGVSDRIDNCPTIPNPGQEPWAC